MASTKTYSIPRARAIAEAALASRKSVLLKGPPGIGKSDLVRQIAKGLGDYVVEDQRLSQIDPPELRGLQFPNRNSGKADIFMPAWLPEPDVSCLILLDEIDKAPTTVKNAALQLLLDRQLGEWKASDNHLIIATANRIEDKAFSTVLGSALSNRLVHIEIELNHKAWLDWAMQNGVDERVIAFLAVEPAHLMGDLSDSGPWAAPRSWTTFSDIVSSLPSNTLFFDIAECTIGHDAQAALMKWEKIYRHVDIDAILKRGELPSRLLDEANSERNILQYAVTTAIISRTRQKGFNNFFQINHEEKKREANKQTRLDNLAKLVSILDLPLREFLLQGLSTINKDKSAIFRIIRDERFRDSLKDSVALRSMEREEA